jgi:hypothetical protein
LGWLDERALKFYITTFRKHKTELSEKQLSSRQYINWQIVQHLEHGGECRRLDKLTARRKAVANA